MTLPEMLGVILLLVVFGFVFGILWTNNSRLTVRAESARDALTVRESVVRRMRADAWGGKSLALADPTTLTIETPDGAVVWRLTDDSVTRTTGSDADAQAWKFPAAGWSFEPGDPPAVRWTDGLHGSPERRETLAVQTKLAERMSR